MLNNPTQEQVDGYLKTIKNIRLQKGISQYEVANRLSISQNTYFKIEKGKTKLDLYRLIQISNILEFEISELFIKTIVLKRVES